MKNSVTEIRNSLEQIDTRIEEAEQLSSDVENRVMESNQAEEQKVKRIKTEKNYLLNTCNVKSIPLCALHTILFS